MVSAFHSPVVRQPLQNDIQGQYSSASTIKQLKIKQSPLSVYDSETEDEEVKMNCIGGVQPYMTSDDEDFDDDEVSCCSDTSRCDSLEGRVPTFVARRICQVAEICRPKAMMGRIQEANEESDASSLSNLDEAEPEMEDFSKSNDDTSTYADDEQSVNEDEELDFEGREDEEEECHEGTEYAERMASPQHHLFIMPSDGTPEVCEENEDSSAQFCDYEGHSIDIIDKVLALDSAVMDLPSSTCDDLPSPRSKRILASLFEDDSDHLYVYDTPKKMRCTLFAHASYPPMTMLTLGPSAESELRGTTRSPFSVEETDRQLTEELTEPDWVSDTECTPVPFLSPPPSPVSLFSSRSTMCEWPSNLAVDNALTMISDLRAHSPASLMRLDEEAESRIKRHYHLIGDTGTGLTPVLQGIRVNLD